VVLDIGLSSRGQRPDESQILNRHLYQRSKYEDEDKPAIIILFLTFQHVLEAHEKEQAYSELSDGIDVKKCLWDEMDPLGKRDKEDLREEVKHLKRCWVQNS
jgi:hypothetical protein